MQTEASKYIHALQKQGPVAWAEGKFGWIGEDGKPVKLTSWQRAALNAWWDNRAEVSTFGISNVKKTGKTFVNSVLLAWRWLALPGQHFAAGNDLDQSQARQFSVIAEMLKRHPQLSSEVKIGKMELEFIKTGSKLTALAADAAGNAGANHLTVSHTESWGILYEAGVRAWEELTPPPGKTYGLPALRVADSYAGFSGDSKTWHKLIDRGLAGERLPGPWPIFKVGGLLLFHMEGQEAQEACFRGSEAERIDYYAEQADSLRPNAFTRMHCNQRTASEGAFVTIEEWQACFSPDVHPLQPGEKVRLTLGADASTSHDYTALVGMDGKDVRLVRVWKPKTILGFKAGKPAIDLDETIGQEVLNLYKAGQVEAVVYDPWQLASVAMRWHKAGVKCIEMPQTAQRVEADTALSDAIKSGQIRHFKSADLDEAVRNAIVIETPRGIRLAKEKASRKIDPLVALSMANHATITSPGGGTVEICPNPFWGENDIDDLVKVDGRWITAPGHNAQAHPKGVTWHNCPHRNKVCLACVAELEADGEFVRQEAELQAGLDRHAGEPMTEAEAAAEFKYDHDVRWSPGMAEQQQAARSRKFIQIAIRQHKTIGAKDHD